MFTVGHYIIEVVTEVSPDNCMHTSKMYHSPYYTLKACYI